MRRKGRILAFVLFAIAALVTAALSFGDVVGQRQTAIISPPGGSPSADGPSDAEPGGAVVPYIVDGARSDSSTPTTDPIVNRPRPADNVEFSQDNRVVKYVAYDSAAKNLVAGQTSDGHHHIFLLTRNGLGGALTQIDPNTGGDSTKP